MLDGVMLSQIPSMFKMESDKEQFLPLCYSVYTLTKLSSYYAVQQLDAKSSVYMGIWVYADDIILLSPNRTGLQEMVKICEKFPKATKLKFSTNIRIKKCKTKCLFFLKKGLIIMK